MFDFFIVFTDEVSTVHDLCSDIWLEIFEYFETIELFTIFPHLTNVVNELLLKNNTHFYARGFLLDADIKNLPEQIPLHRVISLVLHEECLFKIINQCSKLRSLKLIGGMLWVTSIVQDITQKEINLEQLTIVTSRIESLRELLLTISPLSSLRRLEVCSDELEQNDAINKLAVVPSQIEQFILSSSSTIECANLSYMLSYFPNIRLLDIGLIDRHSKTIPLFFLQNLRTLSLSLLEVSFVWITHLLKMQNSLVKLKLTGLVHDEQFIINENWIYLFELTPSLIRIFVNLSLEQDKEFYYFEKFQIRLRALNLQLTCTDDADTDGCPYYGNGCRWWNLKGLIIKA